MRWSVKTRITMLGMLLLAAGSAAATDSWHAELRMLAAAGDVDGLVDLAGRLEADTVVETAQRERLLDRIVLVLARQAPNAAAVALVDRLAARPVSVFRPLQEGGGRVSVPAVDVAASARYALHRWRVLAAGGDAGRWLAGGAVEPLTRGDRAAAIDGLLLAIDAAPDRVLLAARDRLGTLLEQAPDSAPAIARAAERLADAELYGALLEHADASVALRALPAIVDRLSPTDALALLEQALARESLASAALLAAGRLVPHSPDALELLLGQIEEPATGGSAAAALARLQDPLIAEALAGRLAQAESELTRRRIVLALKLDGSPAARRALERAAAAATTPVPLREEIERWLARR